MDMLDSFSGTSGFILLVLGFGFIIFVHEAGHFLVAKAVGIKCPQFAIGFGQALLSFRKGMGVRRGSTEREYFDQLNAWLEAQGETPSKLSGDPPVWSPAQLERAEKALAEKAIANNEELPTDQKKRYAAASDWLEIQGEEKARPRMWAPDQLDRASAALGLSETEYRLNWMPLGGYVKMLGQEDMDPNAASDDPRSYNSKPIWARACVISAGVVMNIIFGILFFILAFMGGFGVNKPVAGMIAPSAQAATVYAVGHDDDARYLGIMPNDKFISIAGVNAADFSDVRIETALASLEEPVEVVVERMIDGTPVQLTFPVWPKPGGNNLLEMGVPIPLSLRIPRNESEQSIKALREIYPKKDLYEAGVRPGMEVVTAGGKEVASLAQLVKVLGDANGNPVDVVFEDKDDKKTTSVPIEADPHLAYDTKNNTYHLLGLTPAVRIDAVAKGSPAEEAGVLKGDLVARISVTPWPTGSKISQTVKAADGAPLALELIREGKRIKLQITPDSDDRLGIYMSDDGDKSNVIRSTLEGSLVASLNLNGGTTITSVNGQAIKSLAQGMEKLIQLAATNPDGFEFEIGYLIPILDSEPQTAKLKTDDLTMTALKHARWQPPMAGIFSPDLMLLQTSSPVEALSLGLYKTKRSIQQVYLTLLRLTQGTVPLSGMQGPVGIADTGTRIAKRGLTYLFFFMGLISINLAVINFLPIPIVDGGHIVFLIIEKIKGSPVGPKVQAAALYAGLAVILFVFVFVTYHDIARIVSRIFA